MCFISFQIFVLCEVVAGIFFSFSFGTGDGIVSIKFWFVYLDILYLYYQLNIISKVDILFMVPSFSCTIR